LPSFDFENGTIAEAMALGMSAGVRKMQTGPLKAK
jgi:hypothetical protein